jgi:hypothetical protein
MYGRYPDRLLTSDAQDEQTRFNTNRSTEPIGLVNGVRNLTALKNKMKCWGHTSGGQYLDFYFVSEPAIEKDLC